MIRKILLIGVAAISITATIACSNATATEPATIDLNNLTQPTQTVYGNHAGLIGSINNAECGWRNTYTLGAAGKCRYTILPGVYEFVGERVAYNCRVTRGLASNEVPSGTRFTIAATDEPFRTACAIKPVAD